MNSFLRRQKNDRARAAFSAGYSTLDAFLAEARVIAPSSLRDSRKAMLSEAAIATN